MGSGIKGFKSQKILKSKINGYSFDDSVDPERYATIQELTGDKHGLDVVNHGAFKVNLAAKTVEAGSNVRVIKNTAHGAIKGDQIRFITDGIEASVLSIPDANTIILGSELNFDPTGLTFDILRHITPTYNSDGTINVSSVTVSGTATVSATDLDIRNLSFAQDKVDVSGSSVTISNTVAVAQGSVGANFYENNSLSGAVNALSGATVKKVYIQADSDNTDAIRFKLTTTGAAASSTSGWKLLPGADVALELGGGSLNTTLSICPVSGTQKVVVQYA